MRKPRRICLEGPNGVGKSTIAAELARLLSPSALIAYHRDRPPCMDGWSARERAAWYLGDMSRGSVREWLHMEAGRTIVRDRWVLSTLVYQAGDDAELAAWICAEAGRLPPADITLVLHLPDDERERRLAASPRGARAELGGAEERARIARLYVQHGEVFPGAVDVDASGSVGEVVERCLGVLNLTKA